MNQHRFTEHTDQYPYACTVDGCIYRTVNSWSLRDHIASKHSDERTHKCSQCDFSAKTKTVLILHRRTVHEGRVRQCNLCDFTCPWDSRTKLLTHKKEAHLEALPYKCKFCPSSFHSRNALQTHVEYTHEGTGSRRSSKPSTKKKSNGSTPPIWRYWCSECGDVFQFEYFVQEHIRKMHDPSLSACIVPTNATKPGTLLFKCSLCDISSSQKSEIDNHLEQNHDGQAALVAEYTEDENYKPTYFACDKCNFKSEKWCGLKSHIRARHESKLHNCPHCPYVAFGQGAVSNHMVHKHGMPRQHPKRINKKKPVLIKTPTALPAAAEMSDSLSNQLPTVTLPESYTFVNSGNVIYIDAAMTETPSA